jgi:hypothetical protein
MFSLAYFIAVLFVIKFSILTIDMFGIDFFKTNIKNIAFANIGIFASLTGFLIASIPLLIPMIIKENYLIDAVKNNLQEITISLKILLTLFVTSIFVLFFDINDYDNNIKLGLVSIFIYLYILLLYYLYEIIEILHIFVSDLKELKNNMTANNKNNDKIINILEKIDKKLNSRSENDT